MSLATLLKKGSLQGAATAIPATSATDGTVTPPKVARVATVAVANAQNLPIEPQPTVAKVARVAVAETQEPTANDPPIDDPDRWCWPASSAMNGAEIDLFGKRVDLFFYRNLPLPEAETMADKLVLRDRDRDDRRVCMECSHLVDIGHGWRCPNWQRSGVALKARDNELPADFVIQLQRCDGFSERTL